MTFHAAVLLGFFVAVFGVNEDELDNNHKDCSSQCSAITFACMNRGVSFGEGMDTCIMNNAFLAAAWQGESAAKQRECEACLINTFPSKSTDAMRVVCSKTPAKWGRGCKEIDFCEQKFDQRGRALKFCGLKAELETDIPTAAPTPR